MAAISGRLGLADEVYLRSLTGYLVGTELVGDLDRIAIIALPDRICMSLAASVASSYISKNGYKTSEGRIRIYQYGDDVRRIVEEFKPNAIVLLYGGEHRLSEVREAFMNTLRELSKSGFSGTLVIHVRILLATNRLNDVLSDESLVAYLNSLKEVRTFTADLAQGKFFYHKVRFAETGIQMEKIGESSLTSEHVSLLKASLPPT